MIEKKYNIMFGMPFSGKETLCKYMQKLWQFKTWSAREQIAQRKKVMPANSVFSLLVEKHEKEGTLIPDENMMSLFSQTFRVSDRINFHGMPRNVIQARTFMMMLKNKQLKKVSLFHLEMTKEESMKRFIEEAYPPGRVDRSNYDVDVKAHAKRLELYVQKKDKTLKYLARSGVSIYNLPFNKSTAEKILIIQRTLKLETVEAPQLEEIARNEILMNMAA